MTLPPITKSIDITLPKHITYSRALLGIEVMKKEEAANYDLKRVDLENFGIM